MPQIETDHWIAQKAADVADELTEHVVISARKFVDELPLDAHVRSVLLREVEKVVAVQILDGTRQNAGQGTAGHPSVKE